MDRLFFPLLWWIPDFPNDEVTVGPFTLLKRKWEVSIFDLYSLVAQKHSVKFPAEVANVFLPHVNCEIGVEHNGDFEATCVMLDVLRAMLYTDCQSPTVAPYASNYSLNSYAGINDRSSSLLRERMHEGLREGITTATSTVTMQAFEPSFVCMRGNNSGRLKR